MQDQSSERLSYHFTILNRARRSGIAILLATIALSLVLPKLILIGFMKTSMGLPFGFKAALTMLPQDLLLAFVAFCLLMVVAARPTLKRITLSAVASTAALALLLIDTRFRQLWLRPLDWSVAKYYWANATQLSSGSRVFFNQNAGLGFTFRRWCFVAFSLHFACWVLALWHLRRQINLPSLQACRTRPWLIAVAVGAASLVAISRKPKTAVYQAEQNLLTSWLTSVAPSDSSDKKILQAASAFDQPLRTLDKANGDQPHLFSQKPEPFKNVIVIVLESTRWKGLGIDSPDKTRSPTLTKLAGEGLLAKCYVALPHSSKAQFTILTGRYPYPGLEIREAMRNRWPSLFWSMREQHGAKTYCFSVQSLVFENTDGMLKACGIQNRLGPPELNPIGKTGLGKLRSSFGEDDALLLGMSTRLIAQYGEPFGAVFLTSSSHYPYNFPGKTAADQAGANSYWKAIAYTDSVIAQLLAEFAKYDLLRDTLVVLTGDHGESFGEHGTVIHNNSMYEEELAVPLIFWSADGRLKHSGKLESRQIDIAPTIADLMGISDRNCQVQGQSLVRKHNPVPLYATSFFGEVSKAIILGSDKFIYFPSDDRLIHYNIAKDEFEENPVTVSDSERNILIGRMRAFDAYQELRFPRSAPDSLLYQQSAGVGSD